MEEYRKIMTDIGEERANILSKIDLVQPSFEEQHKLEWERRYQEEELSLLRKQMERVSQEVETEIKRLRGREKVMRSICDEQRQDRIKIQTLLALSQPITPDMTIILESLGPLAPTPQLTPSLQPPLPRRRPLSTRAQGNSSERNREEHVGTNGLPTSAAVLDGVSPELDGCGRDVFSDRNNACRGGRRGEIPRRPVERDAETCERDPLNLENIENLVRTKGKGQKFKEMGGTTPRDRGFRYADEDGDDTRSSRKSAEAPPQLWEPRVASRMISSSDFDAAEAGSEGENKRNSNSSILQRSRSRQSEESDLGRIPDVDARQKVKAAGTSRAGRRSSSPLLQQRHRHRHRHRHQEAYQQYEIPGEGKIRSLCVGVDGTSGLEAGIGARKRSDCGSRVAGVEVAKEADHRRNERREGRSRLRCTQEYYLHLSKRLELTQKHLEDLDQLGRDYRETLERDAHERQTQLQVQRENTATVVKTLQRRIADVDGRLSGATEEYLRLRHRAKEAHAVSVREQRECVESRQKLEAELQTLQAAAESEVERIAREGQERLEYETQDLREQLGKTERMLQDERSHHKAIKEKYGKRVTHAREGVLLFRRRHRALVGRRAEEVVHLSEEMSALRRGVTELEKRTYAVW